MFEIQGTVTTAVCYAQTVEDSAIEQIRRMCSYPLTAGSRVRIMPDVHARMIWRKKDTAPRSLKRMKSPAVCCYTEFLLTSWKKMWWRPRWTFCVRWAWKSAAVWKLAAT